MTRNALPEGFVRGTTRLTHIPRPEGPDRSLRRLLAFAAVAVIGGGGLLTLSTIVEPGAPFILAAVYFALALPALVLTHREGGGAEVRRLLRDCVRIPRQWWWLPVAGLALPAMTWAVATPLDGARQLTWSFAAAYLVDLVVGAMLINLWEEMAWAGYFQRRAMIRWGKTAGSLVTALFFTAIHLPLALVGVDSLAQAGHHIALLAAVALGVRLVIAHLDLWTGSLLVIGLFHSSFNATEAVLRASHDWVRVALVMAMGILVAAYSTRRRNS